jgi:cytochrome P450 StaP
MTADALTTLPSFNPVDPHLLKNPYPTYARYREQDPVHWGTATLRDLPGSWYLFRYEDNLSVLSDGETFASNPATVGMEEAVPAAFRPVAYVFQRWLGGMDPPNHRVLRSAMAKAFTPRRIAALEPDITAITTALITEAMGRQDGHIDVIADLAFPLPMAVVGAALGVHESDWPLFQEWSADVTNAVDRAGDPESGAAGARAISSMVDYFSALVAERRREPGEDLLSAMLAAADDEGSIIEEFDVIAIATELGVAGHETTANSVAKSVLGLMSQRARWDEFVHLSDDQAGPAIEELLRFSTPVQRQRWRWVTRDTSVGGRDLVRGQAVVSILGAANRDPDVFARPDDIAFTRSDGGRHLTFGIGTHFCAGSTLARLEMRLALRALAVHLPGMRLVESPDSIPWRPNFLIPGPARVLVEEG